MLPEIANIQELIFGSPELSTILLIVVYLGLRYQKTLSYQEYRFFHLGKSFLFRLLDDKMTAVGRPLIHPKNAPDNSQEYITTVDKPPRQVYEHFLSIGASPHLIASTKARPHNGKTQYTHSQVVFQHGDRQSEYYLFYNNGETDIYGHAETTVLDPKGHVTDGVDPCELPEDFSL